MVVIGSSVVSVHAATPIRSAEATVSACTLDAVHGSIPSRVFEPMAHSLRFRPALNVRERG